MNCDILIEIGRKVKENLFNKDKLYLSDECNNHNSEYLDNNTVFNRFENEVLTMNCGKLRENWFDVSNPQIINGKSVFGIKHKTVLDEEFLLLEADDIYDDSEFERVLISSSNTSALTVSNDFTSASHEVPVTIGNSGVAASTSIAPRAMAETLVHCPPCSNTPSKLSVSTQKLEELALKKSWFLIPVTPSMPRSLAASSMEKSKVKTESLRYPFSHFDNSHDVIALRELNGASPESTPISIPSRNTSDSTQSRSGFLKNLSTKSSSKDSSCTLKKFEEASTRYDTSRLTPKSGDAPLVDTSDANSLNEHRSNITYQNGNVLGEPLKLSCNVEQKHKTKPIIHSEEEEIAFLRSLGWEKNSEDVDDEGLTLEEILDFYDKHAQNAAMIKYSPKYASKHDCIAI